MLNPDQYGVLYLIVFRVGIIAAGVISIICGYRLLLAGVFHLHPNTPPTEISGRFGGAEFTFKSVSPGTCFALFGAILIIAMISSAPPEFERSQIISVSSGGKTTVADALKMRGEIVGMAEIVEQAKREDKVGNKYKAMQAYARALRLVAEPLNNLAWLYHEAGRDTEALPLSQLAIQFAPNESAFADTLKKVRERAGKE